MIHWSSEGSVSLRRWFLNGSFCVTRNGRDLKSTTTKALIFSGEISANSLLLSPVFNCLVHWLSFSYLELPLTCDRLQKLQWRPLIERRSNGDWQDRVVTCSLSLSLSGKITKINDILSVIPMYFASFFSLFRWVERELDSLRRIFLWEGTQREGKAFCLVNWKRVCKCKEFDGLGVITLRDFNNALLLKWWWKLFDEPIRKWATLMSHSYRPLTGWWSDRCINKTSASPLWKGMSTFKDIFSLRIAKKVNNKRGVRF